ncbi:MAG: hypothetical protein IJ418_09925 [Clostridia bacterium]|nr:hypothetical protein [Clostridia bacterium]
MRREYQRQARRTDDSRTDQQLIVDVLSTALVKAAQNVQTHEAPATKAANNYRSSIDMMELLYHVLSKIKYIIIAAVIGAIVAGSYAYFLLTPKYEATAKLYIMSQDDVAVSLSDLQIGALLTMDYQEVFKTWEVHEMVRQELELDLSYVDMQDMLKVTNPEDTRLLYITVTNSDAQLATDISNAYAAAAKKFILQTMDAKEPNVFSIALVPSVATGMSNTHYVLMGFILGTAMALCVIFLHFVLDDRPRTPEDIMRAAGISTLAIVPKENTNKPKKPRKHEKVGSK